MPAAARPPRPTSPFPFLSSRTAPARRRLGMAVSGGVLTVLLGACGNGSCDGASCEADASSPPPALPASGASAPAPTPASYRKPRIAAVDYTGVYDAQRQTQLAKFDFLILGAYPSSADRAVQSVAHIRALNPAIKVANYTIFSDLVDSHAPSDTLPAVQEVDRSDWWLIQERN